MHDNKNAEPSSTSPSSSLRGSLPQLEMSLSGFIFFKRSLGNARRASRMSCAPSSPKARPLLLLCVFCMALFLRLLIGLDLDGTGLTGQQAIDPSVSTSPQRGLLGS